MFLTIPLFWGSRRLRIRTDRGSPWILLTKTSMRWPVTVHSSRELSVRPVRQRISSRFLSWAETARAMSLSLLLSWRSFTTVICFRSLGGSRNLLDIVNISMGYYHEDPQGVSNTVGLTSALNKLAGAGVTIVASAGNGGSDVEFWPAAMSQASMALNSAPIVSVGSCDPGSCCLPFFEHG